MVHYMPIRKIYKKILYKLSTSKRRRKPDSLSPCLCKDVNKEVRYTKRQWRLFLILLLVLIILYYMYFIRTRYVHLFGMYVLKAMGMDESLDTPLILDDFNENLVSRNLSAVCRINETVLGPRDVTVNKSITDLPLQLYPWVLKGGYYYPSDCSSRHKVAILVPFRDREANLRIFLYNIHPFLKKQKIEYRIFIVEQFGTDIFNRGKVFNAGYKELKRFGKWRCVIFHDVDLLPLDERILYTCPVWPRHLCATIGEEFYAKFPTLLGGVSAMDVQHFEKVNGYSNLYWGWGGEDDDLFWRMRIVGFPVLGFSKNISRYTSLDHENQTKNRDRYRLLNTLKARYQFDGLKTLEYKLVSIKLHHLYTHIVVNINPKKENITKIMSRWTY